MKGKRIKEWFLEYREKRLTHDSDSAVSHSGRGLPAIHLVEPPPRPLVKATLGYAIGITAAHFFPIPMQPLWAAFVFVPLLLWNMHGGTVRKSYWKRGAIIALLAALVGLIRVERLESEWRERDRFLNQLAQTGPLPFMGRVSDCVRDDRGGLRLTVEDAEIESRGVLHRPDGMLDLHLESAVLDFEVRPGDWIGGTAWISTFRGSNWPGGFDARTYFYTEGIVARAYLVEGTTLEKKPDTSISVWNWMRRRSENAVHLFHAHLTKPSADLVSTLAVGQRGMLNRDDLQAFINSGLIHLTAISGLHTTLWLGMVLTVLRWFRITRWWRQWLTPILLVGFVGLVGARVPAVRAAIMAGLLAGGFLLSRHVDRLTGLAAAMLVILWFQPAQAWSVSFQLSFMAIAALMLLIPHWEEWLQGAPGGSWRRKIEMKVVGALSASFVATFALAPLVLFHFNQWAPVAVLANLPAIPLVFVLLCFVYAWMVLAALGLTFITGPLIAASEWLARQLLTIAHVSASLPYSHFTDTHISPLWLLTVLGILAVLATRTVCLSASAGARFSKVVWCTGVIAVGFLGSSIQPYWYPSHIDCLAMGQGDATVLCSRQRAVILVDGGAPPSDYEREHEANLIRYFRDQGIASIDLVVLSHPESDHIGALPELIRAIPVKQVVWNGQTKHTESYAQLRRALDERSIPLRILRRGEHIEGLPGIALTVLHPPAPPSETVDSNESSLVLLVEMEGYRILLPGDISRDSEQILAANGLIPDIDLLKVPHHGSENSSSWPLLDAATPALAAIEVGRNVYGHPAPASIRRLTAAGALVLRTDRDGTVRTVLSRGKGILVWSVRNNAVYQLFGRASGDHSVDSDGSLSPDASAPR